MNNTLIASNQVQGNIGSCSISIAEIESGRGIFIRDIKTYSTNSCTGNVESFYTWRLTDFGALGSIILMISLVVCIYVLSKAGAAHA